jgi:hypothetical protein
MPTVRSEVQPDDITFFRHIHAHQNIFSIETIEDLAGL